MSTRASPAGRPRPPVPGYRFAVSTQRTIPLLLLLGAGAACGAGAAATGRDLLGAGARPGLSAIRGDAIARHARFLSDDLLEGRGTGSRGHAIAARYVASVFEELGLQPAGEGGTYFQVVPLRGATLDPEGSSIAITRAGGAREPLRLDDEVVLPASLLAEQVRVGGPLVYVGFGVTEAELGADVDGKVAVVLWGAPANGPDGKPLSATARAVASDTLTKVKKLAANGAFAVLFVYSPALEVMRPWDRMVAGNRFERIDWIENGTPGASAPVPTATIGRAAFGKLLGDRGFDALWAEAQAGRAAPFDLGASASLVVKSRHRELTSENVAARLPGSDPARAGEVVVYSAHLDHLGIGEPEDGDSIYTGALDNAGGVAGILEIARGFTSLPVAPPRSILFLAVTAEEKGLIGSDYFTDHPTVPMPSIVANINIDGLTPLYEIFEVVARGMEHSTLETNVRAAAAVTGITVGEDPVPEQVIFIRSDQYNFVERGVPAIFPGAGVRDAAGGSDENMGRARAWFGTKYHRPSDEWDPAFLPAWLEKEARLYFLIGLSVAHDAARPSWRPESPFAAPAAR